MSGQVIMWGEDCNILWHRVRDYLSGWCEDGDWRTFGKCVKGSQKVYCFGTGRQTWESVYERYAIVWARGGGGGLSGP